MRTIPLTVLLSAFALSLCTNAHATRVSPQGAANICKGKTATKDGGCAWCGKVSCTTVTCGSKNDCDVIVVHVPEREAKPVQQLNKVPDAGTVIANPSKAAPQ